MLLLGGQRRQILANFRSDKLSEIPLGLTSVYTLRLPVEKAPRTNCPELPLSARLRPLIQEFETLVRPLLFKDGESGQDIKSLWINHRGKPMEGRTLTKEVASCVREFDPRLKLTPVQFRRMTVTRFFGQGLGDPGRVQREGTGEEQADETDDPLLRPECAADFANRVQSKVPRSSCNKEGAARTIQQQIGPDEGSVFLLEKLLNVKQGVMAVHYDRSNTLSKAANLLERINAHLA